MDGKLNDDCFEVCNIFRNYFLDVIDKELIPELEGHKSKISELINYELNVAANLKLRCTTVSEK